MGNLSAESLDRYVSPFVDVSDIVRWKRGMNSLDSVRGVRARAREFPSFHAFMFLLCHSNYRISLVSRILAFKKITRKSILERTLNLRKLNSRCQLEHRYVPLNRTRDFVNEFEAWIPALDAFLLQFR